MKYTEIKPSPTLKNLIQCYWIMDATCEIQEIHHTVLPDGCFDIVIDLNQNDTNSIVLTGIWDKPIPVKVVKNQITVGTRFYPAAIDVFFNCKVSGYNNTVTPFEDTMLKPSKKAALSSLWHLKDAHELISFLDCHFVMLKMGDDFENSLLLHVQKKDLSQNVQDIANQSGLSTRQLNRHYQNRFGISPKTYFSILRFIQAKTLLLEHPELAFTEIATACNYYDQAHFIKEFKRFSGVTPTAWLEQQKLSDFYNTED